MAAKIERNSYLILHAAVLVYASSKMRIIMLIRSDKIWVKSVGSSFRQTIDPVTLYPFLAGSSVSLYNLYQFQILFQMLLE